MEFDLKSLWLTTGIANFGVGEVFMIVVGAVLLYLAIARRFEPLLLVPIGFGMLVGNIPLTSGILIGVIASLAVYLLQH